MKLQPTIATPVEPLDPDTPEGRRVAADLTGLLAELTLAVHRRETAVAVQPPALSSRTRDRVEDRRAA